MVTKFIECTEPTGFNWGKFMLARFTLDEWHARSAVDKGHLIRQRGWSPDHTLVFDLQTGEGFLTPTNGLPRADLNKHQVWVCPMFEPFLVWLYKQPQPLDFDSLPSHVVLPEGTPTAMSGYRRPGPTKAERKKKQA